LSGGGIGGWWMMFEWTIEQILWLVCSFNFLISTEAAAERMNYGRKADIEVISSLVD